MDSHYVIKSSNSNGASLFLKFIQLSIAVSLVVKAQAAILCVDHYPPHQVVDAHGNVSGYAVDFVKQVLSAMDEPLEIRVESTLEQCLWLAKQGQVDLIMGLYKTPEREAVMDLFKFSDGYSKTLLVSLSHTSDVKQLADLVGRRVGVIRGYHYFDAFDNHPQIHRVPQMHLGQLLQLLLKREIDYVAVSQYQWREMEPSLKSHNLPYRIASYRPTNDQPVYLGVVRRGSWHPNLPQLKSVVESLYQQRVYDLY
jgi:polar amino acid transport system substrate-binding protein